MTDWLIGTLLATSGLILLVLMIRETVRRHFGARAAYGLWLIPAARLLMPTLTETVERPVAPTLANHMTISQQIAEPLMMARVAPPEPSLIEEAGGWPTILTVLWLGVAAGLFAARRSGGCISAARRSCRGDDTAAALFAGRALVGGYP